MGMQRCEFWVRVGVLLPFQGGHVFELTQAQHKKSHLSGWPFSVGCALLIVRLATHFADGFAEPNHLAGVSILVVVPNIQHNVFTIF